MKSEVRQDRHSRESGNPGDLSDLLGKRFQYGARGPEAYDCYGLCMEIYRRLGKKLPEFGSAVMPSLIDKMVAEGRAAFTEIVMPEPCCLVLFKVRPPYVSHIGVVLEDKTRFIHIMRNTSVCIERLDSAEWKRRIAGYLTLPA
jgi:cell wall-associated NlpC family hydrolase